jgi:hypothetical protein
MSKIKLLKVGETEDGAIRLQSQLMVGRQSVDFILEGGVLKCWGHSPTGGLGFHECDTPYEVVENVEEMRAQAL